MKIDALYFQSFRPAILSIPTVSTRLELADYLGSLKVRWGFGRDSYKVEPGLYRVGHPDPQSDVLVTANYKLTFDVLRKNLDGLNVWILALDTKGVNVWCSAGKGVFSTGNLVNHLKSTHLDQVVKHRTLIVPQLGATGVAAHKVRELSGFKVVFGPVRAKDIRSFIQNGYKATPAMRTIDFPLVERAKLIPNDFMYQKFNLLLTLGILFFLSGLDKSGFLFSKMWATGFPPVLNLFGAYVAGIVIAPLALPVTPFRVFALKGALWGALLTLGLYLHFLPSWPEAVALALMNCAVASFMMMNFTGSSTYTSLSGVKKEMKWALPIQISAAFAGLVLFVLSRLLW